MKDQGSRRNNLQIAEIADAEIMRIGVRDNNNFFLSKEILQLVFMTFLVQTILCMCLSQKILLTLILPFFKKVRVINETSKIDSENSVTMCHIFENQQTKTVFFLNDTINNIFQKNSIIFTIKKSLNKSVKHKHEHIQYIHKHKQ